MNIPRQRIFSAVAAALLPLAASASSHREAPFITTRPKVDGTDLYMFNSYEPGRAGYVTLIANYQPFENPQGGPNYYTMDPNALYEISIDNNGSGHESLTFQFRFTTVDNGLTVTAGTKAVPVPLTNIGPVTATDMSAQNVAETYTVTLVNGDRRTGAAHAITDATSGAKTFDKPLDNIGAKSIANYAAYANAFIHTINIPGCSGTGRMFVGQRQDPFVVNLGETFDLVNIKYPVEELAPAGVNARNLAPNSLAGYNVTSIALEIPASCLTAGKDPVIGAWTTASVRQSAVVNPFPQSAFSAQSVGPVVAPTFASVEGGAWAQVSRLGMPLVNEVVIGLPDKDRFNASAPKDDAQFADYVTNPALPVLLQALFGSAGVVAPKVYPRTDLIAAFLTGLKGLNQPLTVTPAEELRLNTSIAATPVASQSDLGVLGGDTGGFPNGRRPIDDVVDIELRVAMGVLLSPFDGSAQDPDPASDASRQLKYTDGAEPDPTNYLAVFPYINTALAGSPTSAND
ncbi:MAG TPA: DUF4331 domain-containing protein [Steroidobacteraceae bacterium]|jgi:hypothetical protein|nr:DUF4331 domain-containing protein [Steroidobacteraceae bacterium]